MTADPIALARSLPAPPLDAAALRRAEDDDLARAIALSSDAAPQQGDADLAAAIALASPVSILASTILA